MKKRILSVLLVIVMLIGIIPAAFGATPKVMLTVEASNSAPNVGDEVTFTLYIQTSDGGSVSGFELPIDVPAGLTYVASSGAVDSSFKSTTGAENFEWIESGTKFFCSSSALEGLSGLSTRQAVGSFKCTVNDDASGTYNVGVSVFALEDKDVVPVTGTDLKNEKAAITVAAHEHSWAAAWTKNETHHWHECENSDCDVTENSGKNGYAAHTYDQQNATAEYKATDATCTTKATYYKSCICGAKGTVTFESGEVNASNHTGTLSGWQTDSNKHWKEYSCCHVKVEEGEHVYTDDADTTCNTCGYIRTVTPPAHEHTFGTWIDEVPATCKTTGTKGHKDCTGCNKHFDADGNEITDLTIPVDPDNHTFGTWVDEVPATCKTTGTKGHKDCTGCSKHFDAAGNEITDLTIPVNSANHEGTLGDWVKTDPDKHWKEYSCCHVKAEEGMHVYTDDADTDCNTCDYIRTVTPPAHEHTFGTWIDEVPATCKTTGTKGHKDCTGCNKHFDADGNEITDLTIPVDPDNHTFGTWVDEVPATCKTTGMKGHKDCTGCNKHFDADGNEITDLTIPVNSANHEGTLGDWVKTDPDKHWKEYSCCGAKVGEAVHDYDDDTDTTCNTCDYERTVTPPAHEHICGDWQSNRLYHWKVCTICDEIVDKARHNYGGDRTCDDCGYVKPRTSSSTTPSQSTDTTKSADTGDMGIALYAGMTVLSLTGGAWVVNKKRKSK